MFVTSTTFQSRLTIYILCCSEKAIAAEDGVDCFVSAVLPLASLASRNETGTDCAYLCVNCNAHQDLDCTNQTGSDFAPPAHVEGCQSRDFVVVSPASWS